MSRVAGLVRSRLLLVLGYDDHPAGCQARRYDDCSSDRGVHSVPQHPSRSLGQRAVSARRENGCRRRPVRGQSLRPRHVAHADHCSVGGDQSDYDSGGDGPTEVVRRGLEPRLAPGLSAAARVRIDPKDVVIVDGIMLLADARLRALFDIKIFVDVADDIRFIRRLERDVSERGRSMDGIIRQYLGSVRPMHLEFVEPSKRYADVILPEGGYNQVGVDMILARVFMALSRRR